MIENIFFDFDKFDIKPESTNNLDIIADYLKKNPEAKFKISGHTDHYGTELYNMDLSKNRAVSVQNYLVNKGVSKAQLSIEYYGEQMQITVETEDDDIRHLNRRVEFSVVKQGQPQVVVKTIIIPEGYLLP
jgi:outer membrane protein OmpA-like peptidoglycan-associated protein